MRLLSAVTTALLLTAVSAASASSAIDVQFSSGSGHAQIGAAVIGQANDVWNDFTTGTLANQFLVNTSGAQVSSTQSNIGTFVEGDNYLYIVATANSSGVVDLKGRYLSGEANINGVQLLAVPEPSSVALLMAGLMLVGGAAVRRSRAR